MFRFSNDRNKKKVAPSILFFRLASAELHKKLILNKKKAIKPTPRQNNDSTITNETQ